MGQLHNTGQKQYQLFIGAKAALILGVAGPARWFTEKTSLPTLPKVQGHLPLQRAGTGRQHGIHSDGRPELLLVWQVLESSSKAS